jgi:hypothetical protein
MHYGFVDDVNRYATDKALKLLRAGNDTLVVVPTSGEFLNRWRTICNYGYYNINRSAIEVEKSYLFIRAANRCSSLRSVCVSGLILVGNIPTFTKRLAIGRTMGHLSPEIYHFRSIT